MKITTALLNFLPPAGTIRPAMIAAAAVLATNTASADNAVWSGAAADGNLWSNVANWAGPPAAVPGTGDTATFNATSTGGIIDLGAGVTVNQVRFDTATCPSITLGAGAVNSQTLTLNGVDGLVGDFANSPGQTLTVNAALTVTGASPRFVGIAPAAVTINGNISTGHTSGTTMLRLNDGGMTLNGLLSNGASALLGLQAQQNTYTLTNSNNSFTGGFILENGTINVASISMTGLPSAAGAGGTIGFGNVFGFGGVNYTGTGDTTDRALAIVHGLNGGRITHSGTGLLKFTSDIPSIGLSGSPTFQLQGNTAGTGELSGSISDHATIGSTTNRNAVVSGATTIQLYSIQGIEIGANVSGSANIPAGTTVTAINATTRTITLNQATTGGVAQNAAITIDGVYNPTLVAKSGSGKWTLSGANTYSGGTTVSGGTLTIDGSLGTAKATISGASTLVDGTGTLTFNINGISTDLITMTAGTLNIAGLIVNVNPSGAGLTATEYVLVNASGGTISGATFAGLTGAPGYALNYDTPGQIKLVQTGGGNTFATWIAGFGLAPGDQGFNFDADGDGVSNGVEAWFGTSPSIGGPGLTQIAKSGNTVTFTHPEADPALSDVTGSYQWSLDLATWNASAATEGSTTVTLSPSKNDPSPGTTTVTATITGTVPARLFVRAVATQP